MVNKYIVENGIKEMETLDITKSYSKLKSKIIKEDKKSPRIENKHGLVILFNFSLLIASGLFMLAIVLMLTNGGLKGVVEYSMGAFAVLLTLYSVHRILSKKRVLMTEEEIIIKTKKELPKYVFETKKNHEVKKLGRVTHGEKNEITGNINKQYIGEVYVLFPKNKSDEHSIVLLNGEEKYMTIKNFSITDIVSCKKHMLNYDESSYSVDTSNMESIKKRAESARTERSIARGLGTTEGLHQAVSNDKKIIAEAKAREEMSKNVQSMEKKKRDETEILVLEFKDGTIFHISHLDNLTLNTLQKLIEQ